MTAFAGAGLRRDLRVLCILVVMGCLLPIVLNRGLVFIAGMVWINAVFGLSFNLLFGLSGVLSFGQAMFFATSFSENFSRSQCLRPRPPRRRPSATGSWTAPQTSARWRFSP